MNGPSEFPDRSASVVRPTNVVARVAIVGRLLLGTAIFCSVVGLAQATDITPATQSTQPTTRYAGSSLDGLIFPRGAAFGFVERTGNALLSTPMERRGRLWQETDDGQNGVLIMELEEPRWERRELSETQVSLIRSRPATGRSRPREQRLSMALDASKPGHSLVLALVALVNGDLDLLLTQFSASSRLAHAEGWRINLTPKSNVEGLCGLRLTGNGDGETSQITSIYLDQCEQRWQEIILQRETDL